MLFLLTVVLVAVRFGRGPAVLATFVSVACFDFFFVPPRFTSRVSDVQYLVTFARDAGGRPDHGHLTAGLRFQARVAAQRESALARAVRIRARTCPARLQTEQIFDITRDFIAAHLRRQGDAAAAGRRRPLAVPPRAGADGSIATSACSTCGIAQWAFDHAPAAGIGTDTLPGSPVFYLPLVAPMRTRGVLAIQPGSRAGC